MPLFLVSAFKWGVDNFKYILYALAVIAALAVLDKLYNTIKENGANQVVIQTLQSANDNQKKIIDTQNKQILLNNYIVEDRDKQLEEMRQKLDGLTDNLGPTENDQAPDPLKEYFKRLQQAEIDKVKK